VGGRLCWLSSRECCQCLRGRVLLLPAMRAADGTASGVLQSVHMSVLSSLPCLFAQHRSCIHTWDLILLYM
jgi:hypothetical protein